MSEPEAATEARRWLRYASEGLTEYAHGPPGGKQPSLRRRKSAWRWYEGGAVDRHLLEGIEFPYTHDLPRLRNLLPDGWVSEGLRPTVLAPD